MSICIECMRSGRRALGGRKATFSDKIKRDNVEFWDRVSKTDSCWLWSGGTYHSAGYGEIYSRAYKKIFLTHRFVWLLVHGELPPKDRFVCHSCDNPPCVNPDHLWLGTPADNMHDMWAKGRNRSDPPRGEKHYWSKLNEQQVREILRLHTSTTQKDLGQRFGVAAVTISHIVAGRSWKHIKKSQEKNDVPSIY